ncbi:MAG: AraC family transcriptional regulator [Alloprevotella sp.]|nr:AraC family transcriptional regulator [Alloprevotella sp.]
MELRNDELGIIIADRLTPFEAGAAGDYVVHALCTSGEAQLLHNEREHSFRKGDCLICRTTHLLTAPSATPDFAVRVIALTPQFTEQCTPQSNYGTRGALFLFHAPVMRLTPDEYAQCAADFDAVEMRLRNTASRFYRDLLTNTVETLFLDFFDFHTRLYPEGAEVQLPASRIVTGFFQLLAGGAYRQHRDIAWYAGQLCVSSKHLSDTCRRVSGHSANHWINRFTTIELRRLLRDKSLTLTNIADRLGFTSPAYFSRYVMRNLGAPPRALR